MRICLISPGHLSTNPRLVKEALALKNAGYEVHVVCGRYQPAATVHDQQIKSAIGHVTQVPFGPFEASRGAYLRQGLIRKAALALARTGHATLQASEAAHSPVTRDLAGATRKIKADLYIAHYVAALPAAAKAARRHGAHFAFDAEDFHLGDLPDVSAHALEKKLIRAIEGRYLPQAAYVTAASPMIAEAYAKAYSIELPTTILNVFPLRNAAAAATPRGSAKPGPSLYWFSQTIGPGRGLETALEAAGRAASRPHIYVRGTPSSGYAEALQTLASQTGVANRLHFLDPVRPDDLEHLGAAYDLGYSGETGFSPNNNMALGNKLFSYLLGGVPSLVSDTPAHRGLAATLGPAMTLFPVGDPAALASAMDSLFLDPDRLADARAQAWHLGQQRYNWEAEQSKVVHLVKGATQPRA